MKIVMVLTLQKSIVIDVRRSSAYEATRGESRPRLCLS